MLSNRWRKSSTRTKAIREICWWGVTITPQSFLKLPFLKFADYYAWNKQFSVFSAPQTLTKILLIRFYSIEWGFAQKINETFTTDWPKNKAGGKALQLNVKKSVITELDQHSNFYRSTSDLTCLKMWRKLSISAPLLALGRKFFPKNWKTKKTQKLYRSIYNPWRP